MLAEIEILREQQHEQNGDRPSRTSRAQWTFGPRVRFLDHGAVEMMALVPSAHLPQDPEREDRREREPCDAALSVRNDDQSREQRPDRATRVAADLKNRLRQAMLAARGQARDARGFGVKDRGSCADERRRHQHAGIVGRERERDEPDQGRGHAEAQRIRLWALVGVRAHQGLQHRGADLVGQGDGADLREAQQELALQ